MTKWFTNVDEVEYYFGLTFTPDQAEMVWTYLTTGVRPPAGCFVCSEGYIRRLTGQIDQYERQFTNGERKWVYPIIQSQSLESIPEVQPARVSSS